MSAAIQPLLRRIMPRVADRLASHRHPSCYRKSAHRLEFMCRLSLSSLQPTLSESTTSNDTDHNNTSLIVGISDGGSRITLNFNDESEFHASWLWSNDPQGVVLPSGQRTTTPAQWIYNGRPTIHDAKIVYCDIDKEESSKLSTERINVPGPTVNDCCHPLAIYGAHSPWVSAKVDEKDSSRPYLFIAWSDKSTSIYDVEWLQRFQYNDKSRLERRVRSEVQPIHAVLKNGPPLWNNTAAADKENNVIYPAKDAPEHGDDGLVHIDYNSVIGQDGEFRDGLFNLLHFIFRDGAVIVSNTPSPFSDHNSDDVNIMIEDESMPVAKLAKAMAGGAISHGMLYGDIFHVRTGERNANNVAYTSSALCPHQDLAYYESTPGMQLLHCVAMGKDVVGGESTLIDAMAAAYQLRELRPKSFETLTKCPATFVKQRDGACMTYRRPHIALAEDRCSIFDREITAVHWSPPFEGPLCLPPEDVDEYYEAYADFERLLNVDMDVPSEKDLASYADEFTWKRKLKPGEVLIFNNRRMLHGRNGFTVADGVKPQDGRRHLVGCYTNIDDTLNTYRVGLRERQPCSPVSVLNVGNGTTIVP
eukprot:scaffold17988_cov194-Skeletonema_marinoi.AAC.3